MNTINEERLQSANRKVADDERRLALQREIVAGLEEHGQPTRDAAALLVPIQQLLDDDRDHRHRIQAELSETG